MFETGWLSLVGLALQIVGLAAVSYDLFRSKSLGDEAAKSGALQDQLDASSRDLMFNLNKHVDLLSNFFGMLVVVIAREGEYRETLRERPNLADEEPEKFALIQHALDEGRSGLRRTSADAFVREHRKLRSAEQVEKALELNAATSKQIAEQLSKTLAISNGLRWIAWIGVTLTASGAVLQLVDMVW